MSPAPPFSVEGPDSHGYCLMPAVARLIGSGVFRVLNSYTVYQNLYTLNKFGR